MIAIKKLLNQWLFLNLIFLSSAFAETEQKLVMICEPQVGFQIPKEITGEEVYIYAGPGQTRTLEFNLQGQKLRVNLQPISTTEFMGFTGEYTLFFEQENDFFVKMILSITDLSTMKSIGPLRLNCYLIL